MASQLTQESEESEEIVGEEETVKTAKPVKKLWTDAEERVLIDLVLPEEDLLFGDLKAPDGTNIRAKRKSTWQKITDDLNSQFTIKRRGLTELKKKFSNLKQRTKEKVDERRRLMRKTGGGPPPPGNTPAEEALLQVIGERPGMRGIDGIDTDDCVTSASRSTITSTICTNASSITSTCTLSASTSTSTICTTSSTGIGDIQCNVGKQRKRKTTKEEIDMENLRNIKLDSERIISEIKLNEMKMKKIKLQTEMLKNKSLYYQLKLQSEFSIVLQNDE